VIGNVGFKFELLNNILQEFFALLIIETPTPISIIENPERGDLPPNILLSLLPLIPFLFLLNSILKIQHLGFTAGHPDFPNNLLEAVSHQDKQFENVLCYEYG